MDGNLTYRRYDPSRDIVRCIPSQARRDLMKGDGAYALATELDQWWHVRGFPQVKHRVEKIHANRGRGELYIVRSNLVNGIPPRAGGQDAAA